MASKSNETKQLLLEIKEELRVIRARLASIESNMRVTGRDMDIHAKGYEREPRVERITYHKDMHLSEENPFAKWNEKYEKYEGSFSPNVIEEIGVDDESR